MAFYRIRINVKSVDSLPEQHKTYYVRLSDFAEAQELALYTATSFDGGAVQEVVEISNEKLVEEVQQSSFIYIE